MIKRMHASEMRSAVARAVLRDGDVDPALVPLSAAAVRQIAAASGAVAGSTVLKSGPNLGAYTLALLALGASVVVPESDSSRAHDVWTTVASHASDHVQRLAILPREVRAIRAQDLISLPDAALLTLPHGRALAGALHVVSELPSIATAVIVGYASDVHRLVATPALRPYGPGAVKIAFYGEMRLHLTVGRTLHPLGTVATFRRHPAPKWALDNTFRDEVFALIDMAFATRTTSARVAFAPWAGSTSEAARWLLAASILPTRNPREFTIEDFVRLRQRYDSSV